MTESRDRKKTGGNDQGGKGAEVTKCRKRGMLGEEMTDEMERSVSDGKEGEDERRRGE